MVRWLLNAVMDTLRPGRLMRDVESLMKDLRRTAEYLDKRRAELNDRDVKLDHRVAEIEELQEDLKNKLKETTEVRIELAKAKQMVENLTSRANAAENTARRAGQLPTFDTVFDFMHKSNPGFKKIYTEHDKEMCHRLYSVLKNMHANHMKGSVYE